jgi:hypothetical protein
MVAILAASVAAQTPPAQDGLAAWQAVAQPDFDPAKFARVGSVVLERDRIQITLSGGAIQFVKPVAGLVYGAAFRGTGRLRVTAPDGREAQQLKLFTGNEEVFDAEFTEAIFGFNDRTFEEIGAKVTWEQSADPALGALFQERLKFGEDYGAEPLPRLVKTVLAGDRRRNEGFYAELKTEKGWAVVRISTLDPEEVFLGMWKTFGISRFVETWMRFPRGRVTSAQAWDNPVAREDFIPESYQIFATATRDAELQARTIVHGKAQWEGERVLNFSLDPRLRATSVKNTATGQAVPYVQARDPGDRRQGYGDYLSLLFAEPLSRDKSVSLEFVYAGKGPIRKMGDGVYFCQSLGWYPVKFNFAMRSNFELNFRSPRQYSLVAVGLKTAETSEGGETLSTWKSEKPIAVAGFAYGDVRVEKTLVGGIEVEVYANRQPDDQMKDILRRSEQGNQTIPLRGGEREGAGATGTALGTLTPASMAGTIATEMGNSIRLLEAYFGSYPYKRLAVSTIPFSYGQGWPALIYLSTLTFLDSFQRQQLGIRGPAARRLTDFFRAHETSHQWWGHKVAWKSYHDQWLSEGFAEFSGNLYLQKRTGNKEYLTRIQEARNDMNLTDDKGHKYDSVGPIWMGQRLNSSESPGAYQRLVYGKGGAVLHMLRMMLINPRDPQDPEARFKTMMKEFTSKFDNAAASTEDFKAVADKHMLPDMNLDGNGRLDWFFNQYVYGTGLPTYEFKYTLTDAGGGQWKLNGTVTQSGVPSGWKDVLPLYMEVNQNLFRVGTVNVMQPVVTIEETMPFKPTKVVLCANEDTIGFVKQ